MRKLIALYWFKLQFGGKKKWKSLYHNGVSFPPEYTPHGIPIIYDGKEIFLDPQTEEYITMYTKYLDTEYVKQKAFNVNFWKDFKKYAQKYSIDSLDKCDLSLIKNYLLKIKEE
jgi:DNA topoisomerase-1